VQTHYDQLFPVAAPVIWPAKCANFEYIHREISNFRFQIKYRGTPTFSEIYGRVFRVPQIILKTRRLAACLDQLFRNESKLVVIYVISLVSKYSLYASLTARAGIWNLRSPHRSRIPNPCLPQIRKEKFLFGLERMAVDVIENE